jgi:hypothetical protein
MNLSGITRRINPVHWKISSKIVAIVITVVLYRS